MGVKPAVLPPETSLKMNAGAVVWPDSAHFPSCRRTSAVTHVRGAGKQTEKMSNGASRSLRDKRSERVFRLPVRTQGRRSEEPSDSETAKWPFKRTSVYLKLKKKDIPKTPPKNTKYINKWIGDVY